MTRTEVQALLRKYSIQPQKKSGQSFLINAQVAKNIVQSGKLSSDDTVLEIGGGFGALTKWLAREAGKVIVVEIDPGLVQALLDMFGDNDRIEVIQGNILTHGLPSFNKIIANLPYSVASNITFRLLKEFSFEYAILMYQKEFANRLLAEPGSSDYSRLTIDFNYLSSAEWLFDVPATDFYPEPAVDSSVLRVCHREGGPKAKDSDVFFWLIHGIYSYPNKKLRKAMKFWLKRIKLLKHYNQIVSYISEDILDERLRNLPIETLVCIADSLTSAIEDDIISHPRRE